MATKQLPDLIFPIYNSKRNSQKTVNFDINDYVNKNDLSVQILSGQISVPSLTTQSIQFNGTTQSIGFTDDDKNNLDGLLSDTRTNEHEMKLTDISYDESLLKTTIDNNCYIDNLTCGNLNVSNLINTTGNLQTQINAIRTATTAITYNTTTQTTSMSDNLIATNFTTTNFTTSNLFLTGEISAPLLTTQSIQFNGTTQTVAFTEDDKNNLDDLMTDERTNINNIKLTDISYNEPLLKTTINNNCYIDNLTCGNLNNIKITDISYDAPLLKTTINNNCYINNLTCGNLNVSDLSNTTSNLQNQINNIKSATTAITYNTNTQTTSISNNLTTTAMNSTNMLVENLTATNITNAVITDLINKVNYLYSDFIPVGTVMIYSDDSTPTGRWLICDGSYVSKTTYDKLWLIIGNTYSNGKNQTDANKFYLPDLRGLFIRMSGTNTTYSSVSNGTVQGGLLKQYQSDTMKTHTHGYTRPATSRNVLDDVSGTGKSRETVWDDQNDDIVETTAQNSGTSTETRPHCISMTYIIKY